MLLFCVVGVAVSGAPFADLVQFAAVPSNGGTAGGPSDALTRLASGVKVGEEVVQGG
jgi:hypothetical protein